MTEQTVTQETEVEATPSADVQDAQDLESILSEYDQEVTPKEETEQVSEPALSNEDQAFLQDLKAKESERQVSETIQEMQQLIPENTHIPEKAFRALVEHEVSKDARALDAFMKKGQNPDLWKKVSKALVENISSEFQSTEEKKSTDDRQAVIAAVQSVSKSQDSEKPSKPYSEMTDAEFAAYERSLKK